MKHILHKFTLPGLLVLLCFLLSKCSSRPYETITTDRVVIPRAEIPDTSLQESLEVPPEQVVAPTDKYQNKLELHLPREVLHPEIRTPMLYPKGLPLQPPVLMKNSGAQLKLSFDHMDMSYRRFGYRFVHCDRNWQPSEFYADEFISAENYFYFESPGTSRGTLTPFTHYAAVFPDEHTSFEISGNYLIEVFDPDNPEEVLLRAGFMVAENLMDINVEFQRPVTTEFRNSHQAIQVKAQLNETAYQSIADDFTLTVYQNFRADNPQYGITPKFTRAGEIVFTEQNDLLFPGGREYRSFDTRERDGSGVGIAKSDMTALYRNYILMPEEVRAYQQYRFRRDANGNVVIGKSRNIDPYLEADYVEVTFVLKSNLLEEKPVVKGNWMMWNGLPFYLMEYKEDESVYFAKALLKEGHYDYQFWHIEDEFAVKLENRLIEGNRYETENAYQFFIYYSEPGRHYDRIAGYKSVNTVN